MTTKIMVLHIQPQQIWIRLTWVQIHIWCITTALEDERHPRFVSRGRCVTFIHPSTLQASMIRRAWFESRLIDQTGERRWSLQTRMEIQDPWGEGIVSENEIKFPFICFADDYAHSSSHLSLWSNAIVWRRGAWWSPCRFVTEDTLGEKLDLKKMIKSRRHHLRAARQSSLCQMVEESHQDTASIQSSFYLQQYHLNCSFSSHFSPAIPTNTVKANWCNRKAF